MLEKPRWLVLNKADLMFEDEAQAAAEAIVAELDWKAPWYICLLYTSDAADERSSVDLGGRRLIKNKKKKKNI